MWSMCHFPTQGEKAAPAEFLFTEKLGFPDISNFAGKNMLLIVWICIFSGSQVRRISFQNKKI